MDPTRAVLFFSSEKKEFFGLVAFPFFLFIEKSFHVLYLYSITCKQWAMRIRQAFNENWIIIIVLSLTQGLLESDHSWWSKPSQPSSKL